MLQSTCGKSEKENNWINNAKTGTSQGPAEKQSQG